MAEAINWGTLDAKMQKRVTAVFALLVGDNDDLDYSTLQNAVGGDADGKAKKIHKKATPALVPPPTASDWLLLCRWITTVMGRYSHTNGQSECARHPALARHNQCALPDPTHQSHHRSSLMCCGGRFWVSLAKAKGVKVSKKMLKELAGNIQDNTNAV